jgi:hypothetical protein
LPLFHSGQTGSGAYPASSPMSTGGASLGVTRPGREADYSPPSGAEVKNVGAIPPLPHIYCDGFGVSYATTSQNTRYIRCDRCYSTASRTKVDTRSINLTVKNA